MKRKPYVPPVQWIVIGGLGAIGSRFIDRIALQWQHAVILDPGNSPRHLWTQQRLLRAHPGQIQIDSRSAQELSQAEWNELFRLSSAVLHVAGDATSCARSHHGPGDWEAVVGSTRALLEACRLYPGKVRPPVVVLSSVVPYRLDDLASDLAAGNLGVKETWPLDYQYPVTLAAAIQSEMAVGYARIYNLPITVFRCSSVYADAPCEGPEQGWFGWMCIQAALGWPIKMPGAGDPNQDLLYCEDVAYALELGCNHIQAMRGQIFNLGAGIDNMLSLQQAVKAIVEYAAYRGIQVPVIQTHERAKGPLLFATDTTKLRALTGWTSKMTPRRGLQKVFEWAREHEADLKVLCAAYAP